MNDFHVQKIQCVVINRDVAKGNALAGFHAFPPNSSVDSRHLSRQLKGSGYGGHIRILEQLVSESLIILLEVSGHPHIEEIILIESQVPCPDASQLLLDDAHTDE